MRKSIPVWFCLCFALLCAVPAQAQIAFRAASSVASPSVGVSYAGVGTFAFSSSNSDFSPGLPAGTVEGDFLVMVLVRKNGTLMDPPAGWTTLERARSNGQTISAAVFYRFAPASPTAPTLSNATAEIMGARIMGFRGVSQSNPINDSDIDLDTNSNDTQAGDVAGSTVGTSMVVMTGHVNDACTSVSNPSPGSWTQAFMTAGSGGFIATLSAHYRMQTAAGNQSDVTQTRSACTNDDAYGVQFVLNYGGLSIPVPTGTVEGDVMVATIASRPSSTNFTTPVGWTVLANTAATLPGDGITSRMASYWRVATASEPASYTWPFSAASDGVTGSIVSFSGVDTGNPVDVSATTTTPSGYTHSAPSVTTTLANTMLVSSHAFTSSTSGWTAPTGMTEAIDIASHSRPNAVGMSLEINYESLAASGASGTRTATASASGTDAGYGIARALALRPALVEPLADWRMDEFSWNGTAGEVLDSSGNGYHGRAAAVAGPTATTATGSPAYTSGAQSTCRYGQFDSVSAPLPSRTYVQLASFPSQPTRFTYAGWIRSSDITAPNQRILVNDDNQNGWALSLGDGGSGRLRVFNRNVSNSGAVSGDGNNPSCGVFCLDTDNAVSNNTWRYVALTVNTVSQDVELYIFNTSGTRLVQASTKYSGTWTNGSGAVAIGGETAASSEGQNSSFHFRGNIDELQVFGAVLSETQLRTQLQRTRPCSALDHIEFVHDGAALTCTAEPVTVLACASGASCLGASGSQVGGSFTITPTTVSGTQWCADALCATPISGSVAVSTGSVLYLRKPAAGVVRMAGVVNSSASNATIQCRNTATSAFNATTACDVDYATAGLLLNAVSHASCTPQTITLQAVKANDTNTRCVPAFSGINHALSMSLSYLNPASGTRTASFDYVTSSGGATSNVAAMGTGNVTLSNLYWDANATATITNFRYPDVGRVRLNPVLTGSGSTSGLSMSAISGNEFIAAPASFSFSSITAGPIIASTDFSATVTAMNACATPAATPNFGLEAAPESVTLSLGTRVAPSGTSNCSTGPCDGTVSGNVTLPWSNGAATASNLRYSEVGEITLAATLASGNYLLSGLTASGTSPTTGAFIPAYFDTAVTPACGTAFTYSGQPFSVAVTAYNNVGGITRNYSSFTPACSVCSKDVTLSNAGSVTGFNGTNTVTAASFAAGVGTKTTVVYTFPSRLTEPSTIILRAVDSTNSSVNSSGRTEGSTLIRSGRTRLLNASGSELLDLPVPFSVEYWSGASGWQRSTNDVCTGTAGNAVSLDLRDSPSLPPCVGNACANTCVRDTGSPGESAEGCAAAAVATRQYHDASSPGGVFQGNFNLWLKAPGAGNAGVVFLEATVPDWLKFPWVSATPSNPTARAIFGVIRSGPVIYRREAY